MHIPAALTIALPGETKAKALANESAFRRSSTEYTPTSPRLPGLPSDHQPPQAPAEASSQVRGVQRRLPSKGVESAQDDAGRTGLEELRRVCYHCSRRGLAGATAGAAG